MKIRPKIVGLSFKSDHIARCNSTQLHKTVLSSWALKVITFPDAIQLNKTVLLSSVMPGDVIKALEPGMSRYILVWITELHAVAPSCVESEKKTYYTGS